MSENTPQQKIVLAALGNYSRNNWYQLFDKMVASGDCTAQDVSDVASRLSVLAGEVSVYFGYRKGFGCGDHGHEIPPFEPIERSSLRSPHSKLRFSPFLNSSCVDPAPSRT